MPTTHSHTSFDTVLWISLGASLGTMFLSAMFELQLGWDNFGTLNFIASVVLGFSLLFILLRNGPGRTKIFALVIGLGSVFVYKQVRDELRDFSGYLIVDTNRDALVEMAYHLPLDPGIESMMVDRGEITLNGFSLVMDRDRADPYRQYSPLHYYEDILRRYGINEATFFAIVGLVPETEMDGIYFSRDFGQAVFWRDSRLMDNLKVSFEYQSGLFAEDFVRTKDGYVVGGKWTVTNDEIWYSDY